MDYTFRMIRTLLSLLVISSVASCKTPPLESPHVPVESDPGETVSPVPDTAETLTFEVGEAWNRHSDFGADGKRLFSQVSLSLHESGKARIEDDGKLKFSHLDKVYGYESKTTEWRNVWMGRWVLTDDVMVIDLDLSTRECEKITGGLEGEGEEKQECPPIQKKVKLECRTRIITLDPLLLTLAGVEAGESDEKRDAWVCHPKGKGTDMGGTPIPWIFGKDSCIEAGSGPSAMARSYGPCRENDPFTQP